jgi:hypothetical protein
MVDLVSTPFAQSLMPAVMDASRSTGIHPGVILAQAALESGFGKHAPGNNLFGIKAPQGNTLATTEVVNGQPVQATGTFGAYPTPEASVAAYADFINRNPRYAAMRAAPDMDSQIAELGRSGYATDPDYAAKISALAHGQNFPISTASLPAPSSSATGSGPLSAPAAGVLAEPPRQDVGSLLSQAIAANSAPAPTQPVAAAAQAQPTAPKRPPAAQLAQALLGGQSGNLLLA